MTETPTTLSAVAEAFRPSALADRGAALWTQMGGDRLADPARAAVLAEACRMADQLDRLDALIAGDVDWYTLRRDDDDSPEVTVVINGAVSERRQSMTVFRHLIAQLTNVAPVALPEPATPTGVGGAQTVDELEQQRAARRAAAKGS